MNNSKKEQNAIILAAGYGIRMIPINTEIPKGLIHIEDEILIERLIKQLHEANIYKITIIVGYMKEAYQYLIDKYDINLVENDDFMVKNNLHSLNLVRKKINNTYIIPCDIWCSENPFLFNGQDSWYMVSDELNHNTNLKVDEFNELIRSQNIENESSMIGICYINNQVKDKLINRLSEFDNDERYDNCFWEEILFEANKMIIKPRFVDSNSVYEINTYEELRKIDSKSQSLNNEVITLISKELNVSTHEIYNVEALKKGMTNRSFMFCCRDKKYIMRIPGEGTEKLINRRNEAQVYNLVNKYGISDKLIYINPVNGYKITEYINNSRNCDANNMDEVKSCMRTLRAFHKLNLKVSYEFDLFGQIEFYEKLRNGNKSIFEDYDETKEKVYELKRYIDLQPKDYTLTHIDAIPDNFLFYDDKVKMIDWEYASMQDPHLDIAMFAIYSYYDREQVDKLIDLYFDNNCEKSIRLKIYCYIAVCGLLWSNWCEYKLALGVQFGDYLQIQYNYAKTYYEIVEEEMVKSV